jgi:pectate lyase
MKKTYLILLFIFSSITVFSQDYYMATPQGYGAATTGGGDATPITVTTWAALRTQMQSSGSKVILVSGVLTVPANQQLRAVITNKSLIGLPGAKLISNTQVHPGGGIIYLRPGSNNVIIRNLIFEGPGAFDIDGEDLLTADGCINLWVDHCEFQDGLDGNFDIKGLTDNVTVSWCKFTYLKPPIPGGSGGSNDHRFSNLVGSGSNDAPADGHFSVTFQNCYWATGCRERMPRARNAQLHILNCYYNTGVTNARALGLGGGVNNTTCYVENTNFSGITNVYTNYPGDGGTVSLSFNNSINSAANIGTVPVPNYTTTAIPVNEVISYLTDVTCGSGATLNVSSIGVITPNNCTFLSVEEVENENNIRFYPSLVKDVLHIGFVNDMFGKAKVTIYNVSGQQVFTYSKQMTADELMNLNLEKLDRGIYVCKIQVNEKSAFKKFIKQ